MPEKSEEFERARPLSDMAGESDLRSEEADQLIRSDLADVTAKVRQAGGRRSMTSFIGENYVGPVAQRISRFSIGARHFQPPQPENVRKVCSNKYYWIMWAVTNVYHYIEAYFYYFVLNKLILESYGLNPVTSLMCGGTHIILGGIREEIWASVFVDAVSAKKLNWHMTFEYFIWKFFGLGIILTGTLVPLAVMPWGSDGLPIIRWTDPFSLEAIVWIYRDYLLADFLRECVIIPVHALMHSHLESTMQSCCLPKGVDPKGRRCASAYRSHKRHHVWTVNAQFWHGVDFEAVDAIFETTVGVWLCVLVKYLLGWELSHHIIAVHHMLNCAVALHSMNPYTPYYMSPLDYFMKPNLAHSVHHALNKDNYGLCAYQHVFHWLVGARSIQEDLEVYNRVCNTGFTM